MLRVGPDRAKIAAMVNPSTPSTTWRHTLGLLLAVGVAWSVASNPVAALVAVVAVQLLIALLERLPGLRRSPRAGPPTRGHAWCLRLHLPVQGALLAVGTVAALRAAALDGVAGWAQVFAAGAAVGWITGSLGITYAHELGHRRARGDRAAAWLLMGSVLYAHFMVEHYRGHHPRAATLDDPATARRGESLWRFLPRTLGGSWRSAWALEAARLRRHGRGWTASPLAWATGAQAAGLLALSVFGGAAALVFWLVQAATAVFLLETVNYIEHYGLRREAHEGRPEPFGLAHAWNADSAVTNALLANLQRHSDHHMHPWKPYETLQALPGGPQLPTGYAGCVLLALVPPLWFARMHPRLEAGPTSG